MTKKEAQQYIKRAFNEYYKFDEMNITDYPNFDMTEVYIASRDHEYSYDIVIDSQADDWINVRRNTLGTDEAGDPCITEYEERILWN